MNIESVADSRTIAQGGRELRLLQIGPNSHSESMLAAYLVAERILYSADMFVQRRNGLSGHGSRRFAIS